MKLTYPVQLDVEALHYLRCKMLSQQVNARLLEHGIIFRGMSPLTMPCFLVDSQGVEAFVMALLTCDVDPSTFGSVEIL